MRHYLGIMETARGDSGFLEKGFIRSVSLSFFHSLFSPLPLFSFIFLSHSYSLVYLCFCLSFSLSLPTCSKSFLQDISLLFSISTYLTSSLSSFSISLYLSLSLFISLTLSLSLYLYLSLPELTVWSMSWSSSISEPRLSSRLFFSSLNKINYHL